MVADRNFRLRIVKEETSLEHACHAITLCAPNITKMSRKYYVFVRIVRSFLASRGRPQSWRVDLCLLAENADDERFS
jgi:hypothetical protein